MSKITITKTPIEGLMIIEPTVYGDTRGYFVETFNEKELSESGIKVRFVQDNQSKSTKGVLRGLHYQINKPQAKLVRVTKGRVFDVAVDLRNNSQTYGEWFGVELTEDNFKQFFIPEGFAHGFLVLSEEAVFQYKVSDFYDPNDEGGILWNDPEIAIKWPELVVKNSGADNVNKYALKDGSEIKLSPKDKNWKKFNVLHQKCLG